MSGNWAILKCFIKPNITPIIKKFEPFNKKTTAEEVIKSKFASKNEGKNFFVTGGSSGLGRESCLRFYQSHANVFMLNRNLEKSKIVEKEIKSIIKDSKGSIQTIKCDFSSLSEVKSVAQSLIQEKKKIDVLLLNAGVLMPPEKIETKEKMELQMAVNHFNQFAFLMTVLPLLNKDARVVFVSSTGHTFGTKYKAFDINDLNFTKRQYVPITPYYQSKMCNIMTSKYLNKLMQDDPRHIIFNSIKPGVTRTSLGSSNSNVKNFLKVLEWFKLGNGSEIGASTQVFACVDSRIQSGGKFFAKCEEHEVTHGVVDDEELQKKLYEISLEFTKIEDPFKFQKKSSEI